MSSKYAPSPPSNESQSIVSSAETFVHPQSADLDMRALILQMQGADDYRDQIVPNGHRTFAEHIAEYGIPPHNVHSLSGDLSQPLSAELTQALSSARGISRFYSHQANAINDLWNKKHVIVSTSTASGKSLIYQLPVLYALERDPAVKALYIFPTKALAQDQKKSLVNILSYMQELSNIVVETFDGDTPQGDRARIREHASG